MDLRVGLSGNDQRGRPITTPLAATGWHLHARFGNPSVRPSPAPVDVGGSSAPNRPAPLNDSALSVGRPDPSGSRWPATAKARPQLHPTGQLAEVDHRPSHTNSSTAPNQPGLANHPPPNAGQPGSVGDHPRPRSTAPPSRIRQPTSTPGNIQPTVHRHQTNQVPPTPSAAQRQPTRSDRPPSTAKIRPGTTAGIRQPTSTTGRTQPRKRSIGTRPTRSCHPPSLDTGQPGPTGAPRR